MEVYNKENLINGLTLITSNDPRVNSVYFFIGIKVGSRFENEVNNGISHLVEHLVFRNIKERLSDKDGQSSYILSNFDAFTTKENTKYFFQTTKEDIGIALSIFDEFFAHNFTEEDLAAEKEIIREELLEFSNNAEDVFIDASGKAFWGNDSLSLSVLGSVNFLDKISLQHIDDFVGRFYVPANAVVVAVGGFDEQILKTRLANLKGVEIDFARFSPPKFNIGEVEIESKSSQVLASWLFPGTVNKPAEYVKNVFFTNMMERYLDNSIRKSGFTYTLGASIDSYIGFDVLEIYSAFDENKLETFKDLISKSIEKFKNNLSSDKLNFAKKETIKSLGLLSEDLEEKGNYLLNSELKYGEAVSIGDVIDIIKEIIESDFDEYCKTFFQQDGLFVYTKKVSR